MVKKNNGDNYVHRKSINYHIISAFTVIESKN